MHNSAAIPCVYCNAIISEAEEAQKVSKQGVVHTACAWTAEEAFWATLDTEGGVMNTVAFLRLLYGDDAPDHLALWTLRDRKAYWLPAGNLAAAGRLAERLSRTDDVYCGVALHDKEAAFTRWRKDNPHHRGEPTTRGYSNTAVALPGLWADIDVQGLAHKAVHLPLTKAAARALLTEFPLPPTLVIDSGHGLQAWWLFRELWVFENEAERQAAQALACRFLATLQSIARAHGWHIDPTADLARLLRLPGTWNRKLDPLPVRVIEEAL